MATSRKFGCRRLTIRCRSKGVNRCKKVPTLKVHTPRIRCSIRIVVAQAQAKKEKEVRNIKLVLTQVHQKA
jgi:hypothetical protein